MTRASSLRKAEAWLRHRHLAATWCRSFAVNHFHNMLRTCGWFWMIMWYEIIRGLDHNMWMIFWVYILPQTPVLLRACLPSGWFWMIWVVRCQSYVHHMFVGCRLFVGFSSVVLRWDTRDHVIGPCGRLCLYRCQRPAVGVSTSGRRKRVGQTCLDRWLTDVGHVESLDHIGSYWIILDH